MASQSNRTTGTDTASTPGMGASGTAGPTPELGGQPASATGNLADLVTAAAERGPDHPALVEPAAGTTVSWSRLDALVGAEAARLSAAGVQPGERVVIRLGHGVAFCVTLLGVLRAGAIAVPVNIQSSARELAAIVADCQPTLIVAPPGDAGVAETAGSVRVVDPPELSGAGDSSGARSVGGGEDIAVLCYTSGTTGRPRGAMLSHRALLANRAQIARLRPAPVSPADRVLLHLPLFHIYGLGAGLLQVCWAGATGVLVARAEPAEVVEVICAERVTVVAGVPTMYRSMLELPAERLRESLVSVRLCTAGAAPLSAELSEAFRAATGLELFEGYGLTETGPVLTTTLVGGRAKPGSVGRPLPDGPGVAGVQLRLDFPESVAALSVPPLGEDDPTDLGDDDEDELPDTGLVTVRGPNLFSGYWPDGAGGPDPDGWFRTCDVGFLDADGDLHLVDRVTDLVIVSGFNVYPSEVEQVLDEHPAIAEAAVVGVPDERTGEAVKAVVVPRPGTELTVEQVREHCAARLARFKVPAIVEFAERLPRVPTGELARRQLRGERAS